MQGSLLNQGLSPEPGRSRLITTPLRGLIFNQSMPERLLGPRASEWARSQLGPPHPGLCTLGVEVTGAGHWFAPFSVSPHSCPLLSGKVASPWPWWAPPGARVYSINICQETSSPFFFRGWPGLETQSLELLLPDPAKLWSASSQGPGSLAFVFGHWFSAIGTHLSDLSGRTCYASDVGGDNWLCTHTPTLIATPAQRPTYCTLYSQATGPERGCKPSQASKAGRGSAVGPEASWEHHHSTARNNLWGKAREQQLGT